MNFNPVSRLALSAAIVGLGSAAPVGAANAQALTVYCSVLEEWCQSMANAFTRETGVQVNITRKGSGETFAQIRAEASNPRGDVWWGGTGDPHLQAAQEDLTEAYESPMLAELQPWATQQAEQSEYKTVGIYAGALGFVYNTELLADAGLEAPRCWADLIKPEFEGEVQMANPMSSGTAYTALATLVQLLGEDEAFEYLGALNANINEYTRSGSAPASAAARGETMVGVVFIHDGVTQVVGGFPVEVAAPCEGTGYEIGSMSLIKDGPNPEAARQWYDWALTAAAQEVGAASQSFQVPSNVNAAIPEDAPDLEEIELIEYDFVKYGDTAERDRLLGRWDSEIGSRN